MGSAQGAALWSTSVGWLLTITPPGQKPAGVDVHRFSVATDFAGSVQSLLQNLFAVVQRYNGRKVITWHPNQREGVPHLTGTKTQAVQKVAFVLGLIVATNALSVC